MFTILKFKEISTLPFELRPTNRINLDVRGNVSGVNNSNNSVSTNNASQDHPTDAFSSIPPSQRACIDINLPMSQRMTANQLITYRNHGGRAASYDEISIFSLRPPELLYVFCNPVDYFRLCVIGDKVENEDKIEE